MQKCFPQHLRMRTAIVKYDKETDKECKKRGVSVESSKASMDNGIIIKYFNYYLIFQLLEESFSIFVNFRNQFNEILG